MTLLHRARKAQWCVRAAQLTVLAVLFFLPIVYLPWTTEPLALNKQTVLLVGVALAAIAWFGSMMVNRKVVFLHSWAMWLAILFLAATALSSAFSLAPFTSWIGQSGQEYTSFLTIVALTLLYVIVAHLFSHTEHQRGLWVSLFGASAVVGLISLFALVTGKVDLNLIGTPSALGLYLSVMTILACALWLVNDDQSRSPVLPNGTWGWIVRADMLTTGAAAVVVLLVLDFWLSWLTLIVGLGVILLFALLRVNEFPKKDRLVFPLLVLAVSLLFMFVPGLFQGTYPTEVAPSYAASWEIMQDTLADNSLWFGSGPGTFAIDYSQHYGTDVNQTVLWDKRFDRSGSHIITWFATLGAFPMLVYVVGIALLFAASLTSLLTQRTHDEWKVTFVTFSGWITLLFAQVFYSSNMTLQLLFWVLSGMLVSQVVKEAREKTFERAPRQALLAALFFVVTVVALLTLLFVSVSRYAADMAFAKSIDQAATGVQLENVIVTAQQASTMNRLSDVYVRNLSQLYLARVAQLVQVEEVNPTQVRTLITASINAASQATTLSPNNVVNWGVLGDVYLEVAPLVEGADEFAIVAYQEATQLAPNNPKYHVALGRAYVAHAQQQEVLMTSEEGDVAQAAADQHEVALASAVSSFEKAIELKSDYATAYYYLALALERQGNLTQAIERMELLHGANPYDVGVSFQLGLLYLRQGKAELAQEQFEWTLELEPRYSNARWYLSAVYEQRGNSEAAIEQVALLLEQEPENSLIQQRLERLQAGTAVETPEPLETTE